jgi:hypothetical protein
VGNNTWVNALDPFPTARGAAFNTFTTAKDVSPTPLKYTYGNELKIGTIIQLEAVGEFSTTGTPTLRLGFAYGITSAGGLLSTGVELCGSALTATGSGAAAWGWHINYFGLITAEGASGICYGSGWQDLASSLTAGGTTPIPVTAAARSATIDTTAKKTWHVFAEFGTSNAANQVRVDVFNVKIENQGKQAG